MLLNFIDDFHPNRYKNSSYKNYVLSSIWINSTKNFVNKKILYNIPSLNLNKQHS